MSGIKTEALPDMHLTGIPDLPVLITSEFMAYYIRSHVTDGLYKPITVEIVNNSLLIINIILENKSLKHFTNSLVTVDVGLYG